MSAVPDSIAGVPFVKARELVAVKFAALAAVLAVLGVSTIRFTAVSLWTLWTTDALKSIGMLVPVVSLVLVLRAWKKLNWEARGSWWGLLLLLLAMTVSRAQEQAILMLVISPHWETLLPPPSLVLLAYGSGVVLLAGGTRLYRAALFPILLLLFANPVPHVFSLWVDLPLQQASAHVARAFAMHLGHPLTPDNLRLMFTPDFGMFIAPGCNGIRGSIVMGFIALIAGYLYQFRWYATALVTVGAILLGYLFNLLRLCLLVLYYILALHFPSLQNKAENADYIIGAVLFLIASILLFTIIHKLRAPGDRNAAEINSAYPESEVERYGARGQYVKLAAMGVMVLVGCAGVLRGYAAINPYAGPVANVATKQFPTRLGNYTLVRSWSETAPAGPVVYLMAEYAPVAGGTPITVGVSPSLSWHDPLICHLAQDQTPVWRGQLTLVSSDVGTVNFSSALYNDGTIQYLEASTVCTGKTCGESVSSHTHLLLYAHPAGNSLLSPAPQRLVPVLLRVETANVALPADAAREQLTAPLEAFLGSAKLEDLMLPLEQ